MENIKSQMTLIVRAMVSNPPAHGARIVETVLSDANLYDEWRDCIRCDYINSLNFGFLEVVLDVPLLGSDLLLPISCVNMR